LHVVFKPRGNGVGPRKHPTAHPLLPDVTVCDPRQSQSARSRVADTLRRMPVNDVTRLQKDFAKVASTGKVTAPSVEALIKRMRKGGVTESEAKALRAEYEKRKAAFSAPAAKVMDTFIKDKLNKSEILDTIAKDPGPLKNPAVLKGDLKKVQPELIEGGELFRNGVSGKDPEQNYIGDCYLMAAMSSVANSSPEAIAKMFKAEKDGTYTVTLFDRKGGKLVPHPVRVDADLPRNGWYGYVYARSHDPKELWPALLEKAFAARAGSYGKIEAGVPGEAMEEITGLKSTDLDLRAKGTKPDDTFAKISAAVKAGKPITAATLSDASAAKYTNTNIYADHTYSIFGVSTEGGQKFVQLRNPWGSSEPANNGRDDGVFKLPLQRFMELFSGVSING
jgi:hypothetical protein